MKKEILVSFLFATGIYAAAHAPGHPATHVAEAEAEGFEPCPDPKKITYDVFESLRSNSKNTITNSQGRVFNMPHSVAGLSAYHIKTKKNFKVDFVKKNQPSGHIHCVYQYHTVASAAWGGAGYEFALHSNPDYAARDSHASRGVDFSHLRGNRGNDSEEESFDETPERPHSPVGSPKRRGTPPPLPHRVLPSHGSPSSSSRDSLRGSSSSSDDDYSASDIPSPPRYNEGVLDKSLRRAARPSAMRDSQNSDNEVDICIKILAERDRVMASVQGGGSAKKAGIQLHRIADDIKKHNCH